MRGRKPKPEALKALEGNRGKRKPNAAAPRPAVGVPDCPEHLDDAAKEEWRRIVPELEAIGVLTRVDGIALALYCQAYSRWIVAEEHIAKTGPCVRNDKGNMVTNPYVWIANNAMKQIKAYLIEFGLTPSSRSRVQRVDAKKEDPEADALSGAARRGRKKL